jgi:hypothetical protein
MTRVDGVYTLWAGIPKADARSPGFQRAGILRTGMRRVRIPTLAIPMVGM